MRRKFNNSDMRVNLTRCKYQINAQDKIPDVKLGYW